MEDNGYKYRKIFKLVAQIFVRCRFRYTPHKRKLNLDTPFIMLANHVTDYDIGFMLADVDEYFRPVASEHVITAGGTGPLVKKFFDPITVYKGSIKVGGVRKILRSIRDGQSIMLHPEGARSFDGTNLRMDSEIGKLVRSSKAALVTYKIQGGYLLSPRWAKNPRKGKAWGQIVNVYTADEVRKMSVEEITEIINRDLHEDAYETQKVKKLEYKAKGLAEGIENLIFICPECGSIGTLKGEGDYAKCSCGFSAKMDTYGYFNGTESVRDWNIRQKKQFDEMYEGDIHFEDDGVIIARIEEDHSRTVIHQGKIEGSKEGIKAGENFFRFCEFDDELDLQQQGYTGNFAIAGVHYEIEGAGLNLYKYWMLHCKHKELNEG